MPKHTNGRTSGQRGGGRHGTDNGRGGDLAHREDHGAPQEATGRRAARRADRSGTFRVGILGGVTTSREGRARDWNERIRNA